MNNIQNDSSLSRLFLGVYHYFILNIIDKFINGCKYNIFMIILIQEPYSTWRYLIRQKIHLHAL